MRPYRINVDGTITRLHDDYTFDAADEDAWDAYQSWTDHGGIPESADEPATTALASAAAKIAAAAGLDPDEAEAVFPATTTPEGP